MYKYIRSCIYWPIPSFSFNFFIFPARWACSVGKMGRYDDIPMLFHAIFPIFYSNRIIFNVTRIMVNDIGTISNAIAVPSIVKAILLNGISIPLNGVSASSVIVFATFHEFAGHYLVAQQKNVALNDGTMSSEIGKWMLGIMEML